jgi:hypothetical protein
VRTANTPTDPDLYERLRAHGLRKKVARQLADLQSAAQDGQEAPMPIKEIVDQLEKILEDLKGYTRDRDQSTAAGEIAGYADDVPHSDPDDALRTASNDVLRTGPDLPAEPQVGTGGGPVPEQLAHRFQERSLTPAPVLRAEEDEPAYIQTRSDDGAVREQPLLRAWRDVHVNVQTHVAAVVLLALAGLALGFYFGFD